MNTFSRVKVRLVFTRVDVTLPPPNHVTDEENSSVMNLQGKSSELCVSVLIPRWTDVGEMSPPFERDKILPSRGVQFLSGRRHPSP